MLLHYWHFHNPLLIISIIIINAKMFCSVFSKRSNTNSRRFTSSAASCKASYFSGENARRTFYIPSEGEKVFRIDCKHRDVVRWSTGSPVKQESYLVRKRCFDFYVNILQYFVQISHLILAANSVVLKTVSKSIIFNKTEGLRTQDETFNPSVSSYFYNWKELSWKTNAVFYTKRHVAQKLYQRTLTISG